MSMRQVLTSWNKRAVFFLAKKEVKTERLVISRIFPRVVPAVCFLSFLFGSDR